MYVKSVKREIMKKRDYSKTKADSINKFKDFMIQVFLGAIALIGIVASVPIILNKLF
tara:strand:+ start:312 stop:482 length:171 start_codon:yes stop_codon:yes gene_type:complete